MKDSNISIDISVYDDLDASAIEELRNILESEQGKPFTFEEAKEIGVGLLKLFSALAEDQEEMQQDTEEVIDVKQPQCGSIMSQQLSLIY